MGKSHNGRPESDLQWAMQYVYDVIADKILSQRKTDCVGVLVYNNANISKIIYPIKQCFLNDIKTLQERLTPIKDAHEVKENGLLDAIFTGLRMIVDYTNKNKYIRNLVIVTNARGPQIMPTDSNIDLISKHFKDQEINFKVVGIDFSQGSEAISNNPHKAHNEMICREIASKIPENFAVVGTAEEAIERTCRPVAKHTMAMKKYSGLLTLGDVITHNFGDDTISIPIDVYTGTRATPPISATATTAKKFMRDETKNNGIELCKVSFATEYYISDGKGGEKVVFLDEEEEETDAEVVHKKERGYRVGSEFVVLGEHETEQLMKVASGPDVNSVPGGVSRMLEIVGFMPYNTVPRWMGTSGVEYVLPGKNSLSSSAALASFVRALYETDSVALVRANASGGRGGGGPGGATSSNPPRLVDGSPTVSVLRGGPEMRVLVPQITEACEMFVSVRLPFSDDVRPYEFAPVGFSVDRATHQAVFNRDNVPSEEMQDAMDSFVDAMDVMEDGAEFEGEATEWGVPEDIVNPLVHRLKQVVKHVGIYGKPGEQITELPPIPSGLLEYAEPPVQAMTRAAAGPAPRLEKAFKVTKAVPKSERNKGKRDLDVSRPAVASEALDLDGLLAGTWTPKSESGTDGGKNQQDRQADKTSEPWGDLTEKKKKKKETFEEEYERLEVEMTVSGITPEAKYAAAVALFDFLAARGGELEELRGLASVSSKARNQAKELCWKMEKAVLRVIALDLNGMTNRERVEEEREDLEPWIRDFKNELM